MTREEFDKDFWSITSDTLRFFKMGFLTKELLFDIDDDCGPEVVEVMGWVTAGLSGPYSHVTSDSFNQLSLSGETVRKRCFDLAQVLHEAFSSLDLSP